MTKLAIRKKRSKAKLNYDFPAVVVTRSNQNVTAQIMEPVSKRTLFTVNSYKMTGTKTEKSIELGKVIATKLKELNLSEKVIFDRNGLIYHGRVKAIADSIRENGVNI
jgi:large subunit ribosomal protein L18